MDERFDLQKYLTEGVEQVIKDALKATLKDPRESAFLAKFALASAKANKVRVEEEKNGLHVPSYLIASITSSCNLHCAGCYSRCNQASGYHQAAGVYNKLLLALLFSVDHSFSK